MSSEKYPSWHQLLPGGIIDTPGNSRSNQTGRWDSNHLVKFFSEKCINCLLCWPVCPDESIIIKDGKMIGIDLKHCKNCGHCIEACPARPEKALKMVDVSENQKKL